jgi:hypothetical protein
MLRRQISQSAQRSVKLVFLQSIERRDLQLPVTVLTHGGEPR